VNCQWGKLFWIILMDVVGIVLFFDAVPVMYSAALGLPTATPTRQATRLPSPAPAQRAPVIQLPGNLGVRAPLNRIVRFTTVHFFSRPSPSV
jgi:hypothetical protein